MEKKEYFVVSEMWFNENENPATQSQVTDVCDTLENAKESMESLLIDFEEDNIGEDEREDWTYTNNEKMCGRYKNDDTLWYEVTITHITKTYDENGYLDKTEIDRTPN